MRFLKREVESLERSTVISTITSSSNTRHSSSHTTAASLVSLNDKNVCAFCGSDKHLTKDGKMSLTAKRDILRKSGRCFRCANRGHSSRKCRSAKWLSCAKCKGKHLTSLGDPSYTSKLDSSSSTNMQDKSTSCKTVNLCAGSSSSMLEQTNFNSDMQSATNLCAYNSCVSKSNVFLKTTRGIAVAPNNDKTLLIRFIIDGGSQYSYIREDLVRKLNLSYMGEVNFSLVPFGCKEQNPFKKFKKVCVNVKSQFNNKSLILEAVVVPEICIDVLPPPDASCDFLQNLQLADSYHADIEAENGLSILIGFNYYWSEVTGKQRRISSGLRAVDTIFGWMLQGKHSTGKPFQINEYSCSSIRSAALPLHVLNMNDLISFWSLEAIGIRGEEEENKYLAQDLIT
ncbi:uncharacterized protein LOC129943909 [Eupeodes corollae]|uniref:uncharacterized protein LOC129943909 n=1 Tax=Eupeodes corollae TaxID=290404 RepID=UPI002492A83D|nr:uncharacterized protein LOC129943909 [Eupeodes corollae]